MDSQLQRTREGSNARSLAWQETSVLSTPRAALNPATQRASKKNFLLVAEKGNTNMDEFPDDAIFLRFGKMSKTRFSLDFRYPLSPIVALGIACTTFAKKMVVT